MELPDDPDDPEELEEPAAPELEPEPSAPPLRWSVLSTCDALFLPGAFAVFLTFASFAAPVEALVSVLLDIVALVLGVVLLDVLGVVALVLPLAEPLYVDCGVWLLFELWMPELLMPLVLLLGELEEEVVVSVRGADLFLL